MKRTALMLLATLAVPAAAPAGEFDAWEPVLAKHELRAFDGGTTTLADLRGDVVVVNFWASWCKPCKRELVDLNDWARALGPASVQVVAISIDRDRRKAERFIDEAELSLPVYHDGPAGLAAQLDIPWLPCTVVVDADGRVVRVDGGGKPATLRAMQGTVRSLIGTGRAVVTTEEAAG
jgi:peroxiredoxin